MRNVVTKLTHITLRARDVGFDPRLHPEGIRLPAGHIAVETDAKVYVGTHTAVAQAMRQDGWKVETEEAS